MIRRLSLLGLSASLTLSSAAGAQEQAPAQPAAGQPAASPQPTPAQPVAAASTIPLDDQPAAQPETTAQPVAQDDYAGSAEVSEEQLKKAKDPSIKDSPFILALIYDTALPTGNTKDFTGKYSGRGFTVDGRFRSEIGITLGFLVGWQVFEQKSDDVIKFGNATISGVTVRETSTTPLYAHVGYIARHNDRVQPYAKLGVGTMRVWRRFDMGISRIVDESWHFAMAPEIGAEFPVGRFQIIPAIRYNYAFKSQGVNAQSYVNFGLGFGFD